MASTAGKHALVKVSGVAIAFVDEAFTDSGDHKTYQITSATKRVWDPLIAIAVKVGGVLTAEVYTVDRLRGRIIFANIDAGRGAVTVSGSYLPLSTAIRAKAYAWSLMQTLLDDTDFEDTGFITRNTGLHDVSGTIGRWKSTDTYFADTLVAGLPVVIEFFLAASGTADLVVWALLDKDDVKSAVAGLVEEDISFQGTTDADFRVASTG